MNLEDRLELSYYRKIATLNDEHQIDLVQDTRNNKIYVQKFLPHYNKAVYEQLLLNPIPNIPRLQAIFEDTEHHRLIILEDYVSGKTLEEMLEEHHSFSEDEIKSIICKLCVIVNCLHCANPPIIHRDIKPSNVMMTHTGDIILLDLNAAKLAVGDKAEDTELLGTKGYAAPEQYGFASSGIPADIYAIGMLMNTLALGAFSPTPIQNSPFTEIIEKCVQMDAQKRYQNVNEIIRLLFSMPFAPQPLSGENPNMQAAQPSMQAAPQRQPEKTSRSKRTHEFLKYLPPGFRSLNPFKMFASGVLYTFIIWMSCSIETIDSTILSNLIMRTTLFLVFMGTIYITGNYLNIQQHFSICRSPYRILRWLGVLIIDVIYVVCILILMILATTIFE